MVQFISVLILYTLQTNLGDFQFFYIDLFITAVVAVFMGQTRPFEKLVAKRPSASLISGPNMVSLFLQIFLSLGIQTGVYFYLASRPWYEPLHPSSPTEEIIKCWETTSIFCVSSFQYLLLAVIFRLVPILHFFFKLYSFSIDKYHKKSCIWRRFLCQFKASSWNFTMAFRPLWVNVLFYCLGLRQ